MVAKDAAWLLLGEVVLDVGHFNVLAVLVIDAELEDKRLHVRRDLLLRHLLHHFRQPAPQSKDTVKAFHGHKDNQMQEVRHAPPFRKTIRETRGWDEESNVTVNAVSSLQQTTSGFIST